MIQTSTAYVIIIQLVTAEQLTSSLQRDLSSPGAVRAAICRDESERLYSTRAPSPVISEYTLVPAELTRPSSEQTEAGLRQNGLGCDNISQERSDGDSRTRYDSVDSSVDSVPTVGRLKDSTIEMSRALDSTPLEKPKAVATQGIRRALLNFIPFHLPPVAVTFVLFGLYLSEFQWTASLDQLNALLFAAKIHEALIVGSISNILFHRIRYGLLTSHGVPFGMVSAPFQITDPLLLFKAPYLASIRLFLSSANQMSTTCLVFITVALSILSAPSSGILMLPKLDWWPLPESRHDFKRFEGQGPQAMFIGAPFTEIYPVEINKTYRPDPTRDAQLNRDPLSDRVQHLLYGVDQILMTSGKRRAMTNITVSDSTSLDTFSLGYWEQISEQRQNTTFESIAIYGTSPLALVNQHLFQMSSAWAVNNIYPIALQAKASDIVGNRATWKQPRVLLQCNNLNMTASRSGPFTSFPQAVFPAFNHTFNYDELGLSPIENGQPGTLFVDSQSIGKALGFDVSTAFILKDGLKKSNQTYLCLVDARWVEADVWMSAPYASIQYSGSTADPFLKETWVNPKESQMIKITPEWAHSIDSDLSISPPLGCDGVTSPFNFTRDHCSNLLRTDNTTMQPRCEMIAYSLLLTDFLRRVQAHFAYHPLSDYGRWDGSSRIFIPPNDVTRLDTLLFHQVHSYKLEGVLLRLALTVLLVHVMLVWAHFLLIVLASKWTSRAWSEFGELLALAINTTPTEKLENTGAGITRWDTWRLKTYVRETGSGKLELVFKDQIPEAYEDERVSKEKRDMSVPRPDWRYK